MHGKMENLKIKRKKRETIFKVLWSSDESFREPATAGTAKYPERVTLAVGSRYPHVWEMGYNFEVGFCPAFGSLPKGCPRRCWTDSVAR